MNIFQRLFRKESLARTALTIQQSGQAVSTQPGLLNYSTHGYQKNVFVYRCVSLIAKSCAGIKWDVKKKRNGADAQYLDEHPLLTLLNKPNPLQGGSAFFESFIAYKELTGNSYIEAKRAGEKGLPDELWSIRPDKMKIIPDRLGYPAFYEFTGADQKIRWPVDMITLRSNILHVKSFHPTDPWYGMSPLESASLQMDSTNAANRWNLALLQNQATPSGILKVQTSTSNPTGKLSTEQYEKLKEDINERYSGPRNAGRPMLLEGGLDWAQISLSPNEMKYLESKKVSAEEICLAFGIPGMLMGLGALTFKNYAEARLAFYEETILPLMDSVAFELNRWLVPMIDTNESIELCYDKDDIEALTIKRESKFATVKDANWLKINEKREATGYEPEEGGDVYVIEGQVVEKISDLIGVTPEPPFSPDSAKPEPLKPEPAVDPAAVEEASSNLDQEWKMFNLLNKNERRMSARRQNYRKDRLVTAFHRDIASDFAELKRELVKAATNKEPRLAEIAMLQAVDKASPDIKKTLARHIKYTMEDFGASVLKEGKKEFNIHEVKSERYYNDFAERYIKERTGRAISQIEGTTAKKVRQIVKRLVEDQLMNTDVEAEFDMAKELENSFEGLSAGRARTIARTEVQMAANNATLEAVKALEIPGMKKEWVITGPDDRSRDGEKGGPDHVEVDGQSVDLEDTFEVSGVSMTSPGDEAGGPENVCNCRCVLVYRAGR